MKIQTKATGILERTSHYLKSGVLKEKPAWYDVVGSHPPHIDLTKKLKLFDTDSQKQDPAITLTTRDELTGLYKTRLNKDDRKQKNRSVARVPKLQFLEDQLRDVFYHQHPWEFSRPKNLIERDGQDYKKCDWSHMLQLTKPLDGESVVQRTLWLLQDAKDTGKKLSFFEAYDQSRFEFYRLRLEEESESAISREESTMFGSVYPSSYIEWGLAQEQGHIDSWTKVAGDKMKVKLANREGKAAKSEAPEESFWESNFATDKA